MSNTLALLVSPGGVSVAVSTGGVDFFYAPGAEDGAAPAVAGGYGAKKKWVIRKGGKLEVYSNAADAIVALESEPANDAKESPPEKEQPKPIKPTPKPKPVEVITLGQIKALAKQYDELQAYRDAVAKAQYDGLLALFERLQDEEDVELLLAYA